MMTRQILSTVTRLAAAAAVAVTSASCGSDLLRTGRAPVLLIVDSMAASPGGQGSFNSNLLSDVDTGGSVFNDLGQASIRVILKDQSSPLTGVVSVTTPLQAVTITRYHVTFRRADGRNTPGVDVPFGFDGVTSLTINAGSAGTVNFDLVRHANKLEPPLANLTGLGGQLLITTVAEVTFYGRDQNGNEVTAVGLMDVTFGDFPDDGA